MSEVVEREMNSYGVDGIYRRGWAYFGRLERTLRLLLLEHERRVRNGDSPGEHGGLETRFAMLRFERWWRCYIADRDRQRLTAEALGIEWPPEGARGVRPWVWGHEPRGDWLDVPVVYAPDWDPETHPDVHGFADRWKPGQLVVIPTEEVPVDGDVFEARQYRPNTSSTPALEDGIEEAEVVPDAVPRTPAIRRASSPELQAPPRREEFAGENAMLRSIEASVPTPGLEGLAALPRAKPRRPRLKRSGS